MLQVTVRIPAKVNLVLSVGPPRPDGYHSLETVFHAVSLYDEVVASGATGTNVALSGPHRNHVPADHRNLAARAARALADYAGVLPDVRLRIHKTIPVAGGMAGGSADAAGALLACNQWWGLDLSLTELSSIAAAVGSDVPFALTGGTAHGTGRGERMRELPVSGTLHWVVVVADDGLSTPRVYAQLDKLRADRQVLEPSVGEEIVVALKSGDPYAVARALRNDLEEAAVSLRPSLTSTLKAGRDLGALAGIVSGSGPTCVFLARDRDHATDLAARMAGAAAVYTVDGPVLTTICPS